MWLTRHGKACHLAKGASSTSFTGHILTDNEAALPREMTVGGSRTGVFPMKLQ